jgi:GNAT superfamily N-acetyltransferase
MRLADKECNILALSVLPVPHGVVDDLVVSVPTSIGPADLVSIVTQEGGRCVGISTADKFDLIDHATETLRATANALTADGSHAEALRTVLEADAVRPATTAVSAEILEHTHDNPTDPTRLIEVSADGHRALISLPSSTPLVATRGWTPFTEVEIARASAVCAMITSTSTRTDLPAAIVTADGAGLVLRIGQLTDGPAVAQMHARCSMSTMFARYHSGARSLPLRWLHKLLSPVRGITIVVQAGDTIVGIGQLIRTINPDTAEISLLVEDGWQRRGVGRALLRALVQQGKSAGYRELVGWSLPDEIGLLRTAHSAALACTTRMEDGMQRVSLAVATVAHSSQARVTENHPIV